jgi:hypothetical protein
LAELVEHVGRAIDSLRASELDAFAVAWALYQYPRSAKELWKFCNLTDVEVIAQAVLNRLRSTGVREERWNGVIRMLRNARFACAF